MLQTHEFIRAIVTSILAREEDMAKAVANVMQEGDVILYKRGVRTRNSLKQLQAVFRGRRVRKQVHNARRWTASDLAANEQSTQCEGDTCVDTIEVAHLNDDLDITREQQTGLDDRATNGNSNADRTEATINTESKEDDREHALMESYQEILERKERLEDEINEAEDRLQIESSRLAKILNLGKRHKAAGVQFSTSSSSLPMICPRPPFSAPSTGRKCNNAINDRSKELPPIDEAFADKVTNLSTVQSNLKKKEKRIEDREIILKQRLAKSKHKEAELKLQEQRINDLAGKIRRQQLQLKEQKLQFERSKVINPPSPPSSSRPCTMCTDKELQLREAKDKIRQRMRILSEREAEVVGRAQELRRREIKLFKQQQSIAIDSHHSSCGNSSSQELQVRRQEQTAPFSDSLPNDVDDAQHRRITMRKKRRTGSGIKEVRGNDYKPLAANVTEMKEQRSSSSMRVSLGESVPTIAEESSDDDNDGAHDSSIAVTAMRTAPIADKSAASNEKRTRQRMDIVQRLSKLTPDVTKNSIARKVAEAKPPPTLTKQTPQPTPPTQKHNVFTFEQKGQHHERASFQSIGNRETTERNTFDGGKKSLATGDDKHGDWISTFDIQMRRASLTLNDFV